MTEISSVPGAGGAPAAEAPGPGRAETGFALLAALAAALTAAWISHNRTFCNYGTETDFIQTYLPEAERFRRGGAMEMRWHPPLYPIAIVALLPFFRDGFHAGLFLSHLSGGVCLAANFFLMRRVGGRWAAWGGTAALFGSRAFMGYSAQATSDVFFAALHAVAVLAAFRAFSKNRPGAWFGCGVLLALGFLARFNGASLLLLLPLPFVAGRDRAERVRGGLLLGGGFLLPLALWGIVAAATGSPAWPRDNYLNLAQTYYSPRESRSNVDTLEQWKGKFDSSLDVLTREPERVGKIYLSDFLVLVKQLFVHDEPLGFPFALALAPGLLLLASPDRRRAIWPVLLAFGAQLLVVNFRAFKSRLILPILPLCAGAVGLGLGWFHRTLGSRTFRVAAWTLFLLWSVPRGYENLITLRKSFLADEREISEAVRAFRTLKIPPGLIVARKRHVAHYLGADHTLLPPLRSVTELRSWLTRLPAKRPIRVFFGKEEQEERPHLRDLAFPSRAPRWLKPIAQEKRPGRDPGKPGAWVLYDFDPR